MVKNMGPGIRVPVLVFHLCHSWALRVWGELFTLSVLLTHL